MSTRNSSHRAELDVGKVSSVSIRFRCVHCTTRIVVPQSEQNCAECRARFEEQEEMTTPRSAQTRIPIFSSPRAALKDGLPKRQASAELESAGDEEEISGPHSILLGLKELSCKKARNLDKDVARAASPANSCKRPQVESKWSVDSCENDGNSREENLNDTYKKENDDFGDVTKVLGKGESNQLTFEKSKTTYEDSVTFKSYFVEKKAIYDKDVARILLENNRLSGGTAGSNVSFSNCLNLTAKSEPLADDDPNKRDSLDLEDSLGILKSELFDTPTNFSRTPSLENINSLPLDVLLRPTDCPSPNQSQQDISLGIINEDIFSTNHKLDSILTMDLPLPNVAITRLDQTPSPEELPLDPTPLAPIQPPKAVTPKSQAAFIASITSLDNGYQGDGEMSRPASRGADNSSMTRRPLPRPQPRRPDPMTDSDFYTESDADNHEDYPLRGDRRAQVIDGTLYGVDPQATADIYVNNRENMDSSGVFTDIETTSSALCEHPSGDVLSSAEAVDVSPSDVSTKTISDISLKRVASPKIVDKPKKVSAGSGISNKRPATPSSAVSSPTPPGAAKKSKMPKRNVTSKVKAMMEPTQTVGDVKQKTKPVGRWDAVMNKISKSSPEGKVNLKEVKSKVFAATTTTEKVAEGRSKASRQPQIQTNSKILRPRYRAQTASSASKKPGGSVNSSLSDVSGAGPSKNLQTKKNVHPLPSETRVPKKVFPKEKKQIVSKECGRSTVRGGRAPPSVRSPTQTRAPSSEVAQRPPTAPPKTVEALGVLIQHLVFNLEAFRGPALRREAERFRAEAQNSRGEAEDARLMCQQLEKTVEEERRLFRSEIADLIAQHRTQLEQLKKQQQYEMDASVKQRQRTLEEALGNMKFEFKKLQRMHEESLEIFREENEALREDLDEKNELVKVIKEEKDKWQKQFEIKEIHYKEQLRLANEEIDRLRLEGNHFANCSGDDKNACYKEVESLRAVLDLKQTEVQELRRALAESNQKADLLPSYEDKVNTFSARCEDLETRLERKDEQIKSVLLEKSKLEELLKEEINQKRRLAQQNEELHWRMKQNKEILNQVLEQAEEGSFNRNMSMYVTARNDSDNSYSYERNQSNCRPRKIKTTTELDDNTSPPNSPKVKSMVEKSDSVSYVLDLDESPEIVASRIVRRSFRNTTPPKNTPTKSPANKRPRIKSNPLSLSASASSIVHNKPEYTRSRSASVRNGESDSASNHSDDSFVWGVPTTSSSPKTRISDKTLKVDDLFEEDDMDIPALPSEIGRKNSLETLPMSVASASNSDDESASSSSVQL